MSKEKNLAAFGARVIALLDLLDMCDRDAMLGLVRTLVPETLRGEVVPEIVSAAAESGAGELARALSELLPAAKPARRSKDGEIAIRRAAARRAAVDDVLAKRVDKMRRG